MLFLFGTNIQPIPAALQFLCNGLEDHLALKRFEHCKQSLSSGTIVPTLTKSHCTRPLVQFLCNGLEEHLALKRYEHSEQAGAESQCRFAYSC